MRRVLWVAACVAAGGLLALGLYGAFRAAALDRLPHLGEMRAACGAGAAAASAPPHATPAKCAAYFADVHTFHRSAVIQTVLTGLIAAFVFLVLRLRVYPLVGGRRAGPAP